MPPGRQMSQYPPSVARAEPVQVPVVATAVPAAAVCGTPVSAAVDAVGVPVVAVPVEPAVGRGGY